MSAKYLLENYKLNKTVGRIHILDIFLNSRVALSEKDLQDKLSYKSDRATIYRTLKLFKEKGIIHPVSSDASATKFVLKKEPEEHLHFKCTNCENITCMDDVQIKGYRLPEGYKKSETNFLIIGTCNECNN